MPSKTMLLKIALMAGLGTGIVCLIAGLFWDLLPFNKYSGMFWLMFMPLILYFMRDNAPRAYLVNMLLSFVSGLLWGLLAIFCVMTLQSAGAVVIAVAIDFLICGLIVFVHKGLLGATPLNAVACVFLGFAETLGCLTTSYPLSGSLAAPGTLNGIDLLVIFAAGILVTFCLSWLCEKLVGKVAPQAGQPQAQSSGSNDANSEETTKNA